MLTKSFLIHALSALHVGVGQAIGVVDLPIARSKATRLPLVPGSALKGVLRDHVHRLDPGLVGPMFGPDTIRAAEDSYSGAVAFGDAHLLLLPARSLAGVMAWVTCPFVLRRYAADLALAGQAGIPEVPQVKDGEALIEQDSLLKLGASGKVVFDDIDLTAKPETSEWAKHLGSRLFQGEDATDFQKHFAIISDDNFAFLAETGTEIRARIRMDDEKGVVQKGALWYEENLPAESVLWGVMGFGEERQGGKQQRLSGADMVQKLQAALGKQGALIQIGGKATVGRGLARLSLAMENT